MQAGLIESTRIELDEQIASLKEKREGRRNLLKEQETEKKKLNTEKTEKDKLVKSLSKQEKTIKGNIDKKKKEQEQLKKQISDLIKKAIDAEKKSGGTGGSSPGLTPESKALSASFAANMGKLPWPVEKGEVYESFGEHPHPILENVKTKNNGMDIRTTANATVRSAFKGTVVSVLSNPGYHKAVLIKHGEYFTVYSNLSLVKVKANQEVDTKQSIGSAFTDSQTGLTTVHFEVWKGTQLLNPASWLTPR
jgi:septal ring factor EnvC (AmiA/AmiB activator)